MFVQFFFTVPELAGNSSAKRPQAVLISADKRLEKLNAAPQRRYKELPGHEVWKTQNKL